MKKAFTLIELLVVVLIVGILASIALPQYQKAVAKARVTEAIVAMKALSDAEEIYYLANNKYTATLDELDIGMPTTSNYYTYSCYKNNYESCIAQPKKDGYPVIEFMLDKHHGSWGGRHWCQVWDSDVLTETGKAKATEICKTYGAQDTDIPAQYGPYYLIN